MLLVVVGLTIRSGSYVTLAVAAVTVFFFARKARWEEARLCEQFDGYADYASRTPRFVPALPRRMWSPISPSEIRFGGCDMTGSGMTTMRTFHRRWPSEE